MHRFLFTVAAISAGVSTADAGGRPLYGRAIAVAVSRSTGYRPATPVRAFANNITGGELAEAKSRIQAAAGRMFHPGGSMGSGTHEGVGFSSRSPAEALAMCCYSNSGMQIVEQSVVRGTNGWYATKIYR